MILQYMMYKQKCAIYASWFNEFGLSNTLNKTRIILPRPEES